MKKLLNLLSFSCIILISLGFINDTNSQKGNLHIQLKNIRNNDGVIYVFLYNYENQYPKSPHRYYKVSKSKVADGKLKVKVAGIDFNTRYAITLIDDENNNEDLDRFLGLPTEGFGFSNNVRPLISLPKYNDLLFSFLTEKTININLQYFL